MRLESRIQKIEKVIPHVPEEWPEHLVYILDLPFEERSKALDSLSQEDLEAIAKSGPDLSHLSDEELERIAYGHY